MSRTQARCGICGKDTSLSLLERYNEYTLHECSVCKGQFWDPMKNPGSEWYSHDERYANRNTDPQLGLGGDHMWFFGLLPHPKGRLLDLGMGTGNFLNAARQRGYQCSGVDFDPDALETARSVFGLSDVHLGDVFSAKEKFGEHSFDVITAFQVLEHVDNPYVFLTCARSLLKKGGYVALAMPHRGFADWMKPGDKPPRHLSRWNERTLVGALGRAGFDVIEVASLGVPLWYLVKRFHFWTDGVLSFGLVGKLQRAVQEASPVAGAKPRRSKRVAALKTLALFKDYTLFTIPALCLYVYLWVRGQHTLDVVALARTKI
ncbi:MAG TPA: class I SAM-dependent methyltransferase [Candidatus Paceibacterota bacterium]